MSDRRRRPKKRRKRQVKVTAQKRGRLCEDGRERTSVPLLNSVRARVSKGNYCQKDHVRQGRGKGLLKESYVSLLRTLSFLLEGKALKKITSLLVFSARLISPCFLAPIPSASAVSFSLLVASFCSIRLCPFFFLLMSSLFSCLFLSLPLFERSPSSPSCFRCHSDVGFCFCCCISPPIISFFFLFLFLLCNKRIEKG